MKFIVDTFNKETMLKVACLLKGEVVNEKETLVIVDYDDEFSLHQRLDAILDEEFRIEEMTAKEQTI